MRLRLPLNNTRHPLAFAYSKQAPSRCSIRQIALRCALLCLGRERGAAACARVYTHHRALRTPMNMITQPLFCLLGDDRLFLFLQTNFFFEMSNFRACLYVELKKIYGRFGSLQDLGRGVLTAATVSFFFLRIFGPIFLEPHSSVGDKLLGIRVKLSAKREYGSKIAT